jgi:hypothetical protein
VLIEDPRDRRIRELVPVDRARRLMKRRGISLPAHLGKEPEEPRARAVSPEEQKRQEEERARRLREQQERTEAEIAYRHALLKAIHRKATGPFKREDLQAVLDLIEPPALHAMAQCLGINGGSANMQQVAERMNGVELARFIRCALVSQCVNFPDQNPGQLVALARRFRIDPVAVRKSLNAAKPAKAAKKPAARKAKRK